jgi:hypothetical protein
MAKKFINVSLPTYVVDWENQNDPYGEWKWCYMRDLVQAAREPRIDLPDNLMFNFPTHNWNAGELIGTFGIINRGKEFWYYRGDDDYAKNIATGTMNLPYEDPELMVSAEWAHNVLTLIRHGIVEIARREDKLFGVNDKKELVGLRSLVGKRDNN